MTIKFLQFFGRTLLVAYISGTLIYLNVNPAFYGLKYRTIAVIACLIISAVLAFMHDDSNEKQDETEA